MVRMFLVLRRLSGLILPMASFHPARMWILWVCLMLPPRVNSFLTLVGHRNPLLSKAVVSQRSNLVQVPTASSPAVDASATAATADNGLIVGLNKYSHDSAVCILRCEDGSCVFAGEKERLTRHKHDGGDTADLVSHALASIGSSLEDVRLVVSNNHHHRVAPFERRMPWSVAMGTYPESYGTAENLIPGAAHTELSHHLAHAWSAAALAPFESGLIVVMDGMGEAHGAMSKAETALSALEDEGLGARHEQTTEYYNDLRLMRELGAAEYIATGAASEAQDQGDPHFQQVPAELLPQEAYREAESAYTFVAGVGERLGIPSRKRKQTLYSE